METTVKKYYQASKNGTIVSSKSVLILQIIIYFLQQVVSWNII